MILDKKDIVYSLSRTKVGEDIFFNRFRLHKPSGVVFQCTSVGKPENMKFFAVFALNSKSEAINKEVFEGKSAQSFFEAVAHFEKLIQERIPDKKTPPPSFGMFIFEKGKDGIIMLPDMPPVVVEREDLSKVFTPPMKKPYGRLDMTAVDKPEYESVKSKFALNYNEEQTKLFAERNKVNVEDCAVYDLTPYENAPQPDKTDEPKGEPDQVNDEELTLDKIEGEDQKNMKGSDTNEDRKDEDEQGGEGDEGDKGDEGEGEDKGKGDTDGDKDEDAKGEGEGEGEGDKGDQGKDDGEGSDADGDAKSDLDQKGDKKGKGTPEPGEDVDYANQLAKVSSTDLMDILSSAFNIPDLVETYRRQDRMLDSLRAWTQNELETLIYPKLGVAKGTPKEQFMSMIKDKTKQYFQA